MAKQMRICDQDLIINKVVKSVEQVRREAYEKDIKSQPEWKEFLAETTKHQKEYDKLEKARRKLNSARDDLHERVERFNEEQGYESYNDGIVDENYQSNRPSIDVRFGHMDYSIRQEITEEVRFAGMSGDFNPKQMIEKLIRKFA